MRKEITRNKEQETVRCATKGRGRDGDNKNKKDPQEGMVKEREDLIGKIKSGEKWNWKEIFED